MICLNECAKIQIFTVIPDYFFIKNLRIVSLFTKKMQFHNKKSRDAAYHRVPTINCIYLTQQTEKQ